MRNQNRKIVKLAKIILATSALTLALAGAASAEYFYDQAVDDSNDGPGNNSHNIWTAQHYYEVGSSPTNHYFSITLKGAASPSTNYNFLIDNNPGGGEFNEIGGIDYYFIGKTLELYKWSGSAFSLSSDLDKILTKTDGNKTLTWKVNYNLGSDFGWYATTVSPGRNIYDSTSRVSATPIPAAAWLLGSGIIGLIGIKRRNLKHRNAIA